MGKRRAAINCLPSLMPRPALLAVATAMFLASVEPVLGQGLVVRGRIGAPPRVALGGYTYYPPMSPYARPYHGPSTYQGYGYPRLEGRMLFLPMGIAAPPTPAGVERYTVARAGRVPATAPVVVHRRPSYYPRKSYIPSTPRTSYRGGGYRQAARP